MHYTQLKKDLEVMLNLGEYEYVERHVANIFGWSDEEIDRGEIVIHNTKESAERALSYIVTEEDEDQALEIFNLVKTQDIDPSLPF